MCVEKYGANQGSLQPAKTPKPATKLKLTTPKAPGTGEKGGKKAASSAKTSKGKSKKKADASDEEVETPKEAEKPVDPQEAKAKREKESMYYALSYPLLISWMLTHRRFKSYTFDTSCKRDSLHVTKRRRSLRWSSCRHTSTSWKPTPISK